MILFFFEVDIYNETDKTGKTGYQGVKITGSDSKRYFIEWLDICSIITMLKFKMFYEI